MLTKYVNHQSAFLMKLCAAAHCCTKSFSGPLLLYLNIRHLALLTNSTERSVHRGINPNNILIILYQQLNLLNPIYRYQLNIIIIDIIYKLFIIFVKLFIYIFNNLFIYIEK